jgi:hypothetical protein
MLYCNYIIISLICFNIIICNYYIMIYHWQVSFSKHKYSLCNKYFTASLIVEYKYYNILSQVSSAQHKNIFLLYYNIIIQVSSAQHKNIFLLYYNIVIQVSLPSTNTRICIILCNMYLQISCLTQISLQLCKHI